MACPYFYPVSAAGAGKQPARAPLGALYEGRCELNGAGHLESCNFGYPKGCCEVFPIDSGADAVRFTTLQGQTIYVLEKEHSPVKFGNAGDLQGALARQAEVFESWMTR